MTGNDLDVLILPLVAISVDQYRDAFPGLNIFIVTDIVLLFP